NSAISVEQPISTPPVTTSDTPISTNKLSNRWTLPEIRVLIEEVGKHQQMLQKVKDPREKERIWDTIVSNIQSSSVADTVASNREEPLQNDWEFFYDIDEYLRSDPSVEASITSDSIRGVKCKAQECEELNEDEHHTGEKENLIEEFQTLIKEQTTAIIEAIDCQHSHTTEIQERQHNEQIEIFKQFFLKNFKHS
ncbi:24212_t:CDS:2, partial [Gigaspora rosea]